MATASSSLERQTLPPAYDGIDSDSSPELVPLTRAPIVQNLLVDSPGKLSMRGPVNTSAVPLKSFPDAVPIGFWTSSAGAQGNSILVGYKDGLDGIDPWTVPFYYYPESTDSYSRATLVATYVDLHAGTATDVTVQRSTMPGSRSAALGSLVYGPAFDYTLEDFADSPDGDGGTSDDEPTGNFGAFVLGRKLLKWDGTATAPVVVDGAPDASQDVISHLNRLWVLGGRDVPSGAAEPPLEQSTLYFSVTGGPEASDSSTALDEFSASSWKEFDEVTQSRPRTNKIVVGADDPTDYGVGLGRAAQNLVVFKRRSMYVLSGYDASSFNLRQFSDSHGCLDNRSICQWESGVFFLAEQGFMYFDGAQLLNTTESLRNDVVAQALQTVGDTDNAPNSFAIATRLHNDYIGLCIGTLPDKVLFSGLYHVPRRAWCTFTSSALPLGAPLGFGRAATIPFMVSGAYLVRCDYITAPAAAPDGLYGVDRILGSFTWPLDDDDSTFSGTDDSLTNTETNVEMFPDAGATDFPVISQWRSRLYNLSSPFIRSKLMRVLLDYTAQVNGGTDGQGAWTVRVLDAQGTELANYTVPAQGDPTSYPLRRRHVQSVLSEASEVQLEVTWNQPAVSLKSASILGSGIEFEVTNQQVAE